MARNIVLQRLLDERATLVDTIENVLNQVEGRDLTDAEQQVLERTRERIKQLDDQIKPLEEYERIRDAHRDARAGDAPTPARTPAEPRRMDGVNPNAPAYRSPGHYLVDYLRAFGIMERGVRDEAAMARVVQSRAVADQKTTDTTGILPTPIVGGVVNLIDANRPFITSLGGAKAMGGIPGATFTRPKITQHVTVGQQVPAGGAGEKTQLPSQKMVVSPVSFAKNTYGGTVDISRQDIDWTDPSAWDILITDLANVYSVQTETAVSAAFKTAATATPVTVATNDLKGWTLALYTAAMHSYQGGLMMPNRIWCSLDVWAALGSLVDVARVAVPVNTTNEMGAPGTSEIASFAGDMLGVPRIVCPTFAAGTCIVGPAGLYEVYEEVIGLLSVIEPSILGVQVAYGGYLAQGSLAAAAFIPLTVPAGMPTLADIGDTVGPDYDAYIAQLQAQLDAAKTAQKESGKGNAVRPGELVEGGDATRVEGDKPAGTGRGK
jgi:HK97 family phage major capsid protein